MSRPVIAFNRRAGGAQGGSESRMCWWVPYVFGALAAAAAFAVMTWQLVVRGPFIAVDQPVHEHFFPVAEGAGKVALDWLSRPGQRWFTLPVLLAAGAYVAWRQQHIRPVVAVLVGLGTAYLLGKWTKESLGRTGPFLDMDVLHGGGEAFPSGHVANATYTWALITLLFFGVRGLWPNRRRVYLGFVVTAGLVVLVGAMMVINDYHWVTDVPAGVAVGFMALMAALLAWGPPPARPSAAESPG